MDKRAVPTNAELFCKHSQDLLHIRYSMLDVRCSMFIFKSYYYLEASGSGLPAMNMAMMAMMYAVMKQ
jgi:hypothetical protein